MKRDNIIRDKSYVFAIRIINTYKYLCENKNEHVLSKQLLKSGTSVGANVEEAIGAQSQKDFYAKLNIAYKEARETHYWLRLLQDTKYLLHTEAQPILDDCDELLKIIGSIIHTMKTKLNSK